MDEYGLPKQQRGIQQPKWVYKRHEYLKSLSVAERNFILTGDDAFAFDPLPYTVIYDCFTYADIVRGPAPIQVIKPPQVVQNPVQVIAAPVQVIEPPQVVQNPVQVIAAPVQVIKPPQVVQNPVQVIAAPVQVIEPPQVVQNTVQVIAAPVQIIEKPKATVIVPTIVHQHEPEPATDPELEDIQEMEDDSNPTSPEPPTLLQKPLPQHPIQQQQPQIPVPPELQVVIQRVALRKKIVGFGSKDIERANALKRQLEEQVRLAQLDYEAKVKRLAELKAKAKLLEYQNRTASSSSGSSNYDSPLGSPATTGAAKEKGKLKKNLEQVTNAFSFSFSDSRITRSSFKKKDGLQNPSNLSSILHLHWNDVFHQLQKSQLSAGSRR
jgi:hypothetical protein